MREILLLTLISIISAGCYQKNVETPEMIIIYLCNDVATIQYPIVGCIEVMSYYKNPGKGQ